MSSVRLEPVVERPQTNLPKAWLRNAMLCTKHEEHPRAPAHVTTIVDRNGSGRLAHQGALAASMESRSLRNCLNGKGSIRHLPGAGPRPVQIVIVDADDEMRFILQRVLEQSGRYKCVGSHISAEEAIREVPGASPDLVLKEIRLPDISGIECMRSLKMVLPQLVVVFVSGLGDVETMSDALAAGGDGYLTKPFDIVQCLATLTVALRRIKVSGRRDRAEVSGPSTKDTFKCPRLTGSS